MASVKVWVKNVEMRKTFRGEITEITLCLWESSGKEAPKFPWGQWESGEGVVSLSKLPPQP